MICNIQIVGGGNLGQALAEVLQNIGTYRISLFSKSMSANLLPLPLQPLLRPYELLGKETADLVVLAVNDDRIEEVAERIPVKEQLVVHTSGSTSLNVLKRFPHCGVIYPLQTFTAGYPVKWEHIPVFVEGADNRTSERLLQFCSGFSSNCLIADSQERMKLHISAVFVANFVNHLFTQAHQLLKENNRDFSLLLPLIRQTINKVEQMPPETAQTGPAIRNDRKTMDKHLKMLENHPQKREIYKLISQSITEKITSHE